MINMVSSLCVTSGELPYNTDAQKIYHNGCIFMFFPPIWDLWWNTKLNFKKHIYHNNCIDLCAIGWCNKTFVTVTALILFLPSVRFLWSPRQILLANYFSQISHCYGFPQWVFSNTLPDHVYEQNDYHNNVI